MSEADLHRHVAELVLWYVNGTLEGRDRDAVTAHLPGCPACREEGSRVCGRQAGGCGGLRDGRRLRRGRRAMRRNSQ
jgi:anti-sigma factor RsiW